MFIKRTKGGTKENPTYYLQLVNSYRDKEGKPKHKVLCTLGREDEIKTTGLIEDLTKKFAQLSEKYIVIEKEKQAIKKSYILGPILALEAIWKKLGIKKILDKVKSEYKTQFDFEKAVKLMILNRICDPKSKLAIDIWKEKLYDKDYKDINLHHLYRSLNILADNKDMLQKDLYDVSMSLFKPELKLVFYDLTTFYFESQMEDDLRLFGYSKDNKTDCVQVILALIISKDNIPLGYELFPGNTYEGNTVSKMLSKLKENFNVEKAVIVADKGILSKKVLKEIEDNNLEYIVAAKLQQLPKKYHETILDKSKYKKLNVNNDIFENQNLLFSEMEVDDKRLIFAYSNKRATRDKYMRDNMIAKLQKRIKADPKATVAKASYKKYLSIDKVNVEIDEKKIKDQERWDGLFGFYSNNKELSEQEIIDAYKQLWQIEESFRCMKSTLDLRPVFHRKDVRIEGHIMMCFLSFYIVRIMQKMLTEAKINISIDKALESIKDLITVEIKTDKKIFYARSNIIGLNNDILRALKCKIPSFILNEENVVE